MSCPNTKSLQMFLPVAITPVLNLNQWDTFHISFSETLYGQKLTCPAAVHTPKRSNTAFIS